MEPLRINERPELRNPVLIGAFAGWSDAAMCASTAVQYLIEQWHAQKFADIDPEDFYSFWRRRPLVHLDENNRRMIQWPANDFYYHLAPELPNDFILFIGEEPHMRWRTFSTAFTTLAREFDVNYVLIMGSMITDTVHTVEVPVTGSSNDPEMQGRLSGLIVRQSRYEGPTGITGVVTDRCFQESVKTVSMWGCVPHYIANTPNPKVVVALLRHLRDVLRVDLDLDQMEAAARNFVRQVDEAVVGNDQVRQFIREREQAEGGGLDRVDAPSEPEEFPTSETVIQSLEEFLRQNRPRPSSD